MNAPVPRKILAYLAATFLAGLLAGAVGGYGVANSRWHPAPPPPGQMATNILKHAQADLSLTDAQIPQAWPIIVQLSDDMEAIHRAGAERMAELIRAANRRLEVFLTPEQRDRLHKLEREREADFRKRHGSPPQAPK